MNKLIIAFILLLSLITAITANAEMIPVKTEGRSVIKHGNVNECYEAAKAMALREAVEQVSDIEIKSQTTVSDAVSIKDRVLMKTSGYIRRYRVLSKESVGNECIVRVYAEVNDIKVKEAIEEAITYQMNELDIPSIGFIIRFTVDGRTISPNDPAYNSQDAITKLGNKLREYNIEIKSTGDAGVSFLKGGGKISLQAREQFIKDINKQMYDQGGIGYVAIGEINVRSKGRDSDSASYLSKATTNLDIIRLEGINEHLGAVHDSRTVLGSDQEDANSNAMEHSLENSVDKIAHQVLRNFKNRIEVGQNFIVRLEGVKNNLTQVRPIKKLLQENMQYQSGKTGKEDNGKKIYVMNVQFKGTVSEFEDSLADSLDPIIDRLIRDIEINGNTATVYLK